MRRFDTVLKEIFTSALPAIIKVATGRKPSRLRFLETELRIVKKAIPDILVESEGKIYQVEIQLWHDPEFPFRILNQFVAVLNKFRKPPEQILLWLGSGKPPQRVVRIGRLSLELAVVEFRKIPPETFLNSENPDEVLLALLCKGDPERVVTRLQELSPDEKSLLKYLERIEILAEIFDIGEVVSMALSKIKVDPKKTSLYRMGHVEGMEEGLREAIVLGVRARFGRETAREVSRWLEGIKDIKVLRKIAREVFTASSPEKLLQKLERFKG